MPSRKVKIILGPINEYLIFVAIFFNNRTFSKELMKSREIEMLFVLFLIEKYAGKKGKIILGSGNEYR